MKATEAVKSVAVLIGLDASASSAPQRVVESLRAHLIKLEDEKEHAVERLQSEVERYRKGMENWKATAEDKDLQHMRFMQQAEQKLRAIEQHLPALQETKKERDMLRCWLDIARLRGVAAADREMLANLDWRAPGAVVDEIPEDPHQRILREHIEANFSKGDRK